MVVSREGVRPPGREPLAMLELSRNSRATTRATTPDGRLLPPFIIREHMALQAGKRFGPYEVLSLIAAGGMGEVYRGRDTRLDRKVAVKVLAPELGADTEFRARFEREAKAISSLNHPHICGLYDIGREQDTQYLISNCSKAKRSLRVSNEDHCPSHRSCDSGSRSRMPSKPPTARASSIGT